MKKNFENLLGNALKGKSEQELSIRERIVIRDDFKKLIPELSEEEFKQLEANIKEEGVRDPLVVWHNGTDYVLVDGHNRWSITQLHNIDFSFRLIEFADEEAVKQWMYKTQLGRRNLSPEMMSLFRGRIYNAKKAQGKRNDLTLDQNDPKSTMSTASQLASEYNVSEATIKRDGEFAAGIEAIGLHNPVLKDEILSGKSALSKSEIRALAKPERKSNNATKERSSKKLSVNVLAEIALDYIKNETRSFEDICSILGEDHEQLNAIQYLTSWNALQQQIHDGLLE